MPPPAGPAQSFQSSLPDTVFAQLEAARILTGAVGEMVAQDIRVLCGWREVEVMELSVPPDHAHLCSVPPKLSISSFMRLLKGKLVIKLFKSYPKLRQKPYCRTGGITSGRADTWSLTPVRLGRTLECTSRLLIKAIKGMTRVHKALRYLLASLLFLTVTTWGCDGAAGPVITPGRDEQSISADGGQAVLAGGAEQGGVTVTVPRGAVAATKQITMEKKESSPQVSDPGIQGSIFQLGPDGTQFSTPVEVRLPYPSGYSGDAADLLVFTVDGQGQPEALGQAYSAASQYVAGSTTHFSPFWVSTAGKDPKSIAVSPKSAVLVSGATAKLSATVFNAVNRAITATVTFSSSNSEVAAVDASGTVTAKKVGAAEITATAGPVSAKATVTVLIGPMASLAVSPDSAELRVGNELTFAVNGRDAAGNDHGRLEGASWASDNETVLAISRAGVGVAILPGQATITASISGLTGTGRVKVVPDSVALPPGSDSVLVVTPHSVSVASGAKAQLVASTVRSDGSSALATGVAWVSRDSAMTLVDGAGVLTGAKAGTTYVVASTTYGADSALVSIQAGALTQVVVSPSAIEIPSGATETLVAEARDAAGNAVADVITWASSDPAVASVSDGGAVTAGELGTAVVSATARNGVSGSARVTVTSGEPVAFTFSPSPVTVRAGKTAGVNIDPIDARGRKTPLPDSLTRTLTVRDTTVAVVDQSGNVTGRKTGTTYLVAEAGAIADSVTLNTVPGIAVTGQFLTPSVDTTVTAGDTITVLFQGTDGLGNVFQNTGVVLTSGDDAVVAILTGLKFRGVKVGVTGVTATVDTLVRNINVTVQPAPASNIVMLTPSKDTTMAAGGAVKVIAEVRDPFGNARADAITYGSSDAAVVRVSADTAYAEKAGSANVTATSGLLQAQRAVTVTHGTAVNLAFSTPAADTVELGAGDNLQTASEATDAFGNKFTDGIAFRSTNSAVVSVNSTGLVSGLTIGEAYIVAEINPADSFLVKVIPGALSSVTVAPTSGTANAIGDTLRFKAEAKDGLGNPVVGVTFAWALSNGAVGTLLENSGDSVRFVAGGNGTSNLVVQATKGGLTRADTASIVVAAQVASVTVTPVADTAKALGDTARYTAVARDSNNNVISGVVFTWTSTSTSVGTVSSSGLATAVANGTTSIIAKSPNAKADTAAFVVAQVPTSVAVTPTSRTFTSLTDTATAVAVVKDAGGSAVSGAAVTWSSSNGGIATVNSTGRITAVANGTAKVVATAGLLADTVDVTVSQTPASVGLVPGLSNIGAIGDTVSFTTSVVDARGQAITDATYAWSVSDTGILTLVPSTASTAKVVTAGLGTASVFVQATRGGVTLADTAGVTVTAVPASVVIAPDTATLTAAGATVDLSGRVTVKDNNNNTINGATVTWSSLNNAVATITAAGVVTAVANGSAGMVATSGSVSDTATVTVAIQAARVVITPVADTMDAGGSVQFSATAYDAGGNAIAATVTWLSTNTGAATVNSSGLASGVAAGVTQIIATAGSVADTAQLGVAGANSLVSTAFANGSAQTTAAAGETVTVTVTLDMSRVSATGDLGSLDLTLDYDAALFDLGTVSSPLSGSPVTNSPAPGRVALAFANPDVQGQPKLTVLTVQLTVKAGATAGSVGKLVATYTSAPVSTVFGTYQTPVVVGGEVVVGN